jgi:hypothetical protein
VEAPAVAWLFPMSQSTTKAVSITDRFSCLVISAPNVRASTN